MARHVEVFLPAPVEEVWAHLRDPAKIRRRFGWEYDGLAHEIDVIFLQEAAVDDASHVPRWDDGVQEGDGIELDDYGGEKTTLRVVRTAGGAAYDAITEGWITFSRQLRFALERHPGEERRASKLGPRPGGLPPETPGERYFRTEHQIGNVVEENLLVAWEKPGESVAMVLSSFGATRPGEAAWRAWWAS